MAILVDEDFTRFSSDQDLAADSAWTFQGSSGNYQVIAASDRAQLQNNTQWRLIMYYDDGVSTGDYKVRMTCSYNSNAGAVTLGPHGRTPVATSDRYGYWIFLDATNNTIELYSRDAGGQTLLESISTTINNTGEYIVELSMDGSSITGYVEPVGGTRVSFAVATDTKYAAEGFMGFRKDSSSSITGDGIYFTDFFVEDFVNTATIAVTQADNTGAITAVNEHPTSVSNTQEANTSSITATVTAGSGALTAVIAVTQEDDVSAVTAGVEHPASLTVVAEGDTSSIVATSEHPTSLAVTQEDDTSNITAVIGANLTASVNTTQGSDVASITATVEHGASLAVTQDDDVVSITATLQHPASLAATQEDGTSSITAVVSSGIIVATINVTQDEPTINLSAIVEHGASINVTVEDDTSSISANVVSSGGGSGVNVSAPSIFSTGNETALPVYLVVSSSGGLTGLTTTLELRDSSNPASYLDFSDLTFKTSGWVTKALSLTDQAAGLYSGTLNVIGITNLPTADLLLEYHVAGLVSTTTLSNLIFSGRALWGDPKALSVGTYLGLQ